MSELFDTRRCSHGVRFGLRCDECWHAGLAAAPYETRNSCHVTYRIDGKACPQPGRQSAEGCDWCVYFGGEG